MSAMGRLTTHGRRHAILGNVTTRTLWALLVRAWQRTDQRHELLTLDERRLRDIGVTREAARQEAARHFWE